MYIYICMYIYIHIYVYEYICMCIYMSIYSTHSSNSFRIELSMHAQSSQ